MNLRGNRKCRRSNPYQLILQVIFSFWTFPWVNGASSSHPESPPSPTITLLSETDWSLQEVRQWELWTQILAHALCVQNIWTSLYRWMMSYFVNLGCVCWWNDSLHYLTLSVKFNFNKKRWLILPPICTKGSKYLYITTQEQFLGLPIALFFCRIFEA